MQDAGFVFAADGDDAGRAVGFGELEAVVDELEAVPAPVLVVQGANDRFGMPPAGPGRRVIEIAGDHSLRTDVHAVAGAVGEWLARLLGDGP